MSFSLTGNEHLEDREQVLFTASSVSVVMLGTSQAFSDDTDE